MFKIDNLFVSYDSIEALHGISMHIESGEVVALIGSNGAGKSTLLNTISGLIHPVKGTIVYKGEEIHKLAPNEVVSRGICQVPEGRRIFYSMTVQENLDLGAHLLRDQAQIGQNLERVFQLFPRLAERRHQEGGTLSGGEQQMLAIGRALMSNPQLLLLDEPSLGLSPVMVEDVYRVIVEIQTAGTPILLVEQNAYQALSVATRGYVIETGDITLEDTANRLLENEEVKHAYLGE
jgi:branched-chain amino acid transport system ATP-binding protein